MARRRPLLSSCLLLLPFDVFGPVFLDLLDDVSLQLWVGAAGRSKCFYWYGERPTLGSRAISLESATSQKPFPKVYKPPLTFSKRRSL